MRADQGSKLSKKTVGERKGAAMDSARRASAKAKAVPKAAPKGQKARPVTRGKASHQQWNVIPSGEGSMMRLAREPQTTIMLSASQVKARQAARVAAKKDPQAHLAAVRAAH
jgi:hypothetical protein